MLVLTRRSGESIKIGNDIEVTVLEIQGDKVKIGINAPKNISVMRMELLLAARNANEEAASPDIDIETLKNPVKNDLH
jgi:carbon storage regulator